MDFYEQTFGACPHGGIKPYCPQCAGDRLKEKRADDKRKQEEDGRRAAAESRASGLAGVVENQSAALNAANRRIQALQAEISRVRRQGRLPWRRAR